MSKHTPGPWYRNIPPATRYSVIFAGRATHVAAVRFGSKLKQTLPDDEIEANCNLIAAAPDLLAALHDAQDRLRGAGMLGGDDDPVNAAIAKADGRP